MTTSLEAVTILFKFLKESSLMAGQQKPTGGLYKYSRPFNSDMEDVVINSLPMNRKELQEGVLNVNVHVPNVGNGDRSQANTGRLEFLANWISDLINEEWGEEAEYMFNVQQDNLIQDDDRSWYVNIRVEFRSVNI